MVEGLEEEGKSMNLKSYILTVKYFRDEFRDTRYQKPSYGRGDNGPRGRGNFRGKSLISIFHRC